MSDFQSGFCWNFADCTPEVGLPRLKGCGFDGVELWPNFLQQWGALRWASALQESGMKCLQLCPYFNFVHGLAEIERSREILAEFLAAAAILDCSKLRVFTGPPWGEGVVGAREASEEQWQSAISTLQQFCDQAPEMEFCLECHEGSLMEDAPSTLRLLYGVQRANLTVNMQLPLRDETWETSARLLAPYTTHIHIHNWEKGLGSGDLTFLAAGAFDWVPVLRCLQNSGRSLCLSVEHSEHGGRHDPWETARVDGPFIRDLLRRAVA